MSSEQSLIEFFLKQQPFFLNIDELSISRRYEQLETQFYENEGETLYGINLSECPEQPFESINIPKSYTETLIQKILSNPENGITIELAKQPEVQKKNPSRSIKSK